ncbi:MAG: MBL fold metallo-hydrolase [Actinomycetota bacterium]|nr:MBL fold metallo-hydrolase [Euzebyaceae bacterium]MDQ3452089.1 MBL fold metallo-hydrolase [Actinomycetota bacterium]
MSLRLTVLGCAGTHPGPARMCSSYLLETPDYRLLVDCGNGSLSNLQQRWDVADIDAVLISHLHPDHFSDLYGLYYTLRFHPDGPLSVPVYAPGGAQRHLAQVVNDDGEFANRLHFHAASAGSRLQLGPLTLDLFRANHPVETLALRVATDRVVVAYSADSAATPALTEAARDADLFLCDATWLERHRPLPSGIHMTGAEAGRQAADAGAARLLVTHVIPSNDPAEVAAEAAANYDGEVLVANDMFSIEL